MFKINNLDWIKYVAGYLFLSLFLTSQAHAVEVIITPSTEHIKVLEGNSVTLDISYLEEAADYGSCSQNYLSRHIKGDPAKTPEDYTFENNISYYYPNGDLQTEKKGGSITFIIKDGDGPELDEIIDTTDILIRAIESCAPISASTIFPQILIADKQSSLVTIGDVTVDEGAAVATVPVAIDKVSLFDTVVDIITTTGTAGTTDYTETTLTITIPEGEAKVDVVIPVLEDAIDEPGETFKVVGIVTSGNTINTDPSGTVTITDNDETPTVTIRDVTVDENSTTVTVSLTIDVVSSVDTIIEVSTTSGTAGTADYTATQTTVTIPKGKKAVDVVIPIIEDAIDESDEIFSVVGKVTSGNTSNTDTKGNVTITDNDGTPTVSIGNVTVNEGAGTATVPVTIDIVSSVDTVVDITTTVGSASAADYTVTTTTVTIPAGQILVNIDIPVTDDNFNESTESFTVSGRVTSGNTSTTNPSGTITIIDNDEAFDAPVISLVSSNATISEGNTIQVMISLPSDSASASGLAARGVEGCEMSAIWDYATGAGNAINGEDYTFVDPPSVIASPAEPISIDLVALSDFKIEGSENIDIGVTLKGIDDCSTIPETKQRIVLALVDDNATTTSQKPEPEVIRDVSCSQLNARAVRTESEQSFFVSNCGSGENVGRNFEPEEIASQSNAVLGAAKRQLNNVRSRLDKLRSSNGTSGVDVSGANLNLKGAVIPAGAFGGGASSEGDVNELLANSRWGLFVNGEFAFGEKDRGDDKGVGTGDRNFDFNSKGLTLGADYRFPGEKMIAGVALGYKDFDLDYTTQEGNTNAKGYNLSVYGTYLLTDKVYLDAIVGIGRDKIDSKRVVNNDGTGTTDTTFAIGNPDATELTFSIGGGYEFNKGIWSITPYGRVDYTKGKIDAFTESASDNSARTSMFRFDEQNIESLSSSLGVKASRVVSASSGVYIPHASLEWKHEFKDRDNISGSSIFLENNLNLIGISSFEESNRDGIDSNYYNIGFGVSAIFPKGKSGYVNLESRLGDTTIKDNTIKVGFRWEF